MTIKTAIHTYAYSMCTLASSSITKVVKNVAAPYLYRMRPIASPASSSPLSSISCTYISRPGQGRAYVGSNNKRPKKRLARFDQLNERLDICRRYALAPAALLLLPSSDLSAIKLHKRPSDDRLLKVACCSKRALLALRCHLLLHFCGERLIGEGVHVMTAGTLLSTPAS